MKSLDDFLDKRFPESRRKAYYLMAIHEKLTRVPKQQLREIGSSKATDLAKVGGGRGSDLKVQPVAQEAAITEGRIQTRGRAAPHRTGNTAAGTALFYFKLCKSQLAVIEGALGTAGRMLGSDKSRGYGLEMICANFLAGASLQNPDSETLRSSVSRLLEMMLAKQRQSVLQRLEILR